MKLLREQNGLKRSSESDDDNEFLFKVCFWHGINSATVFTIDNHTLCCTSEWNAETSLERPLVVNFSCVNI